MSHMVCECCFDQNRWIQTLPSGFLQAFGAAEKLSQAAWDVPATLIKYTKTRNTPTSVQ